MAQRQNPSVLQVFLFRNGEFLGTDMFAERHIVVGRDPTVADLVLESSQVSRKHAILEHDGGRVLIRDAGSTNGIYINNKKTDSTEITRLDEVLLGDFSIKIKLVARGKPEVSKAPPTRAMPVPEINDRVPGRRRAPKPKPKQGIRGEDRPEAGLLSDWDDVESEEFDSAPRAEFRDGEVMDKNRFGEMLEDIGISSREEDLGVTTPRLRRKPRARAKARVDKEKPRRKRPEPEPELYDAPSDEFAAGDFFEPEDRLDQAWEPSPGPPAPYDDDDDEDASYEPPYSLVAQLLQEDSVVSRDRRSRGKLALEVLTLQGDSLADAHLLQPGESFWVGPQVGFLRRRRARDLPPRVRLLKYGRNGRCQVEMRKQVDGTLKRGQQRIKLQEVDSMTRHRRRGTKMMGLVSGEVLDIVDGGNRYHVRFVSAPAPVKDPRPIGERVRPDKWIMRALGGSFGAHILALVLVYLFVPPEVVHSTLRKDDQFVEVTLDAAPEMEEPEKPEEEKPEEPEPEAVDDQKPQKMQRRRSKRPTRSGGTSKAPAGVLGLLSKKGSSKAPGPAAAVAAVSNLTAAKVPGAASGYRVSGLIGKLPSNQLSVGGGGGGLMTKGGAALLRGGGGGGGLARQTKRGVGGMVQKNPKAMRSVGSGHLDRDEIQKVINAHIGQIQRCYERELLKTPGLSGKIQVEWTVATSGRVRSARQTYTSMQSTNVSNCILGAIRSWAFPKPRGGEVIVNYPFIFKSIGF